MYKIVEQALDEDDLALAVNAAIYGVGWFGFIEVPDKASWNSILHRVVREGNFPTTDFDVMLLEPREWGDASVLSSTDKEIWSS